MNLRPKSRFLDRRCLEGSSMNPNRMRGSAGCYTAIVGRSEWPRPRRRTLGRISSVAQSTLPSAISSALAAAFRSQRAMSRTKVCDGSHDFVLQGGRAVRTTPSVYESACIRSVGGVSRDRNATAASGLRRSLTRHDVPSLCEYGPNRERTEGSAAIGWDDSRGRSTNLRT